MTLLTKITIWRCIVLFCPFIVHAFAHVSVHAYIANVSTYSNLVANQQAYSVSASGSNDLLAKCVYSVFSHYYPQYDPCSKGLMVEFSFPQPDFNVK